MRPLSSYLGDAFKEMNEATPSVDPDRRIPPGMSSTTYVAHCLWDFITTWFGSRPYTKLALGMPAILLSCVILAGIIARPFYTIDKKIRRYQSVAAEAIESGDASVATMCLEKLWQLDPNDHQTLFHTAWQLSQLKDVDPSAYEYLHRLAPEDKACYAPAHQWVAATLLGSITLENREEALKLAKTHLDHIDAISSRESKADLLWHLYHRYAGDSKEAAAYLDSAARDIRSLSFANWQVKESDPNVSDRQKQASAVEAAEYLSNLIRSGSDDKVRHLEYAAVLEKLNETDKLIELSRSSLEKFPNEKGLHSFFVEILARQFDKVREKKGDVGTLVRITSVTIELDTIAALRQLDSLSIQHKNSNVARKSLMTFFEKHDPRGKYAEMLGGIAIRRKDYEYAASLYRDTIKKNPSAAAAYNNLSWVIQETNNNKPKLESALQLVNRSVELRPNEATFRETRGQILVKLQRWKPAIEDLKSALNTMPDSYEIHSALATAYRALGNRELSSVHADQAIRLTKN